ncbi:MAG: flagellar basal body rod protein FlgB [Polyangiaceae bacterium]
MVSPLNLWTGVDSLAQTMDYTLERQNVLAANLANVDTPEYRARDLVRPGSFDAQLSVELATTDAEHLGGARGGPAARVVVDENCQPGSDGNSVDLDREVVKISANHLRYDAISRLTTAKLSQLLWAVSDGRGA